MMKRSQYTDAFNEVFGNEQDSFVPYNISGLHFNII